MLDVERKALLDVVARCATLDDRLQSTYFEPMAEQDPEVLESREQRWMEAAARGDREWFAELLGAQGLDPSAARDGLRDVRVKDPERVPPWAEAFFQLLDGADFEAPRHPPETGGSPDRYGFGGVFVPLATVAEQALDQEMEDHPIPFSATARQRVIDYLVARWLMVCQAAFTLECRLRQEEREGDAQAEDPDDPWALALESAADWIEVLEEHPLLLRLLGTIYHHWKETMHQLLARLEADRDELGRLLDGRAPRRITDCDLGAGDSHRGGRTVAILTFGDDGKVVYKPRDVGPEAVFNALVRRMNRHVQDLPLRAYDVLVRDDYGWIEFVKTSPTREVTSAADFYRRVGKLLRLLQLLGGHDLHWQNAILSDEQIVILDLEGLLATSPAHQEAGPSAAAIHKLRSSPLASWILPPLWMYGPPGNRPLDNSVLTGGGTGPTSAKRLSAHVDGGGRPDLVSKRLEQTIQSRHPVVDGEPRSPYAHAEDILHGYRDMNRLVLTRGSQLRAAVDFTDITLRFVPRNTSFYGEFLQTSLSPAYLQSGIDRDLCLHRLFRACHEPLHHSAPIVRSEVRALRDVDIPYCRYPADRDCLVLDDETELDGYLEEAPLEQLRERWSGFQGEELEEQLDLVRSSLDASAGGISDQTWKHSGTFGGSEAGRWLDSAVEIGDFILAQANEEEDGTLSFLGLRYGVLHDAGEVAVLRTDLLSGVGGLAIVFADLSVATGEGRFAEVASRLAEMVHGALVPTVEGLAAACRRAKKGKKPFLCGGLVGVGALVYGLRRCRAALAEGELPEPPIPPEALDALADVAPEDVVGGLSGLLLALLAEPLEAGSVEAARKCGAILEELQAQDPRRVASLYPSGSTFLRGIPDYDTGMAYARWRLASATGTEPTGLSPTDFTDSVETAGNWLVRLRTRGWAGDSRIVDRVRQYLHGLDRTTPSLDLLHGLELALEASGTSDDPELRSHALKVAGELQARHRATGSWFPDRLAADRHNLSAVTGLGAVAHALVRLDSAGATRGLRLLD